MSRPPTRPEFPRRVAFVLKDFPVLSQTFVASELAELRRRGIEVLVLSLEPPPESLRHRFIARAGLDDVTIYGSESFLPALADLDPDLLHAHFATEGTAAARALAADLGLPFTFTAHGYDIYDRPPADFADRARAAVAVITVSQANARQIACRYGVPPEHIRVIPSGVDLTRLRPGDGCRPSGPPLVVCVARHKPVKNLGLLLEACARLRDRGTAFHCVLVGDGPCRGELERDRERLGLQALVEMTGAADHDEVVGWWQRASVAVLPSRREGMPVSLMEAAACAVPAVATGVGGTPELVEHEVTGLVTSDDDAPALADALERLVTNPDLAAEMGRSARRRAEERFSLSDQVEALLGLWSSERSAKELRAV